MNKWTLAAVAALLLLPLASGDGPGPGPEVLVMDLLKVVNTCDEHSALVGKIEVELKQLKKKYQGQVKALQQEQQSLLERTLSLRDAGWYPQVEKALLKEGELKALEAYKKVEFADKLARGMEALMKEAKEKARAIMRERGARIVVISKIGPIRLDTENDFKDELLNRRVLTSEKEVDITQEVLDAMNKAFKAGEKKDAGEKKKGNG